VLARCSSAAHASARWFDTITMGEQPRTDIWPAPTEHWSMCRRADRAWALAAIACAVSCGSEEAEPAPGEFEPYFDGQSLDGFELVGITSADLVVENGVLECKCQPNGYLYKNEIFRNFVLKLGYRFERPPGLAPGADDTFTGNSGYFVYLEPPHQIWPRCLEVQGSHLETGDVFGLPGLTAGNDNPDFAALASARRLVGEWNDLQITSVDGALTVELNGVVVNSSTPTGLSEGLIALESEGAEIHWRDVLIKRLP
jgi:hypothetical protein